MFIATANQIDPVPPALKDRLEVLELPGYTRQEKLAISKRFLVPKQVAEHGLDKEEEAEGEGAGVKVEFADDGLLTIIDSYTREAGVRNLEREVSAVIRGIAVKVVEGQIKDQVTIGADDISDYLGPAKFMPEVAERTSQPGVATGLAWTAAGGEIMFVEATRMPGKGGLMLTGQLGDVMKESAQAAMSYVKSHLSELGIDKSLMENHDVHVHVPAGAIPKDGPSAGVAMLSALVSLLTGSNVAHDVAMTGEITLRGLVLPVGGIKEKMLAAHRAGIKRILLPARNEKDVVDVPDEIRAEMEIHFCKTVDDVLSRALSPAE